MERVDRVLQNNGIIFFLQLVNSLLAIKELDIFFYEGTPPSRDSEGQQRPTADDANVNPRFPSPDVLASVIERAQQLLSGSASSALSVCYFSSVSVLCTFYLAMLINQQMIYLDTLRLISCSSKVFASLVIFCIF